MCEYTLIDVAYHEAAHALVADLEGLEVSGVSIKDAEGRCFLKVFRDNPRSWEPDARSLLAGSVSDWIRTSPASSPMTVSEYDLARYLELRDEAGWPYGHINQLANEALGILRQHWGRVEALAVALLADGALLGFQAQEVLARSRDLRDDDDYRVTRRRNEAEILASVDFERVAA